METKQDHFSGELFSFLEALRDNNERPWFEANRARYESAVREPMLQFIADFAKPLARVSVHFIADPRKQGGSMFRINRDVRFSKDKSPYKTNAGAHFRHEAAKDVHAPGFYLHLQPDEVFVGAGLWRPDSAALRKIREAIVEEPDEWKRALRGRAFKATFTLSGESLKRPPKGFDPEHPLIEDLKRKDFVCSVRLEQDQVTAADFIDHFAKLCKTAAPITGFLTRALGLPF